MSDFLKVYGPILALIAIGFVVAYQFVDPAPPRSLVLATGSPEGAYHAYGQRYQEVLARDGVTLSLVESAGSVENLALLDGTAEGAAAPGRRTDRPPRSRSRSAPESVRRPSGSRT